MSKDRDKMIHALKQNIVPLLRERNFSGSFPHFRRSGADRIDLLTFQFDRYGGGFVIEIAQCKPEGLTTPWGKFISPEKVRVWDQTPSLRSRIQPKKGSGTTDWFRFDSPEEAIFLSTALSVVPFIEHAEQLFKNFYQAQKVGQS